MCNNNLHCSIDGVIEPFSFSPFQLLKSYNHITMLEFGHPLSISSKCSPHPGITKFEQITKKFNDIQTRKDTTLLPTYLKGFHSNLGYEPICSFDYSFDCPNISCNGITENCYLNSFHRRQRGEKKPIPDEQKDEKYFERRKRNNEAAKKSRDARKLREDRVALRAAILEQENTLLRAQVIALRDELESLRRIVKGEK